MFDGNGPVHDRLRPGSIRCRSPTRRLPPRGPARVVPPAAGRSRYFSFEQHSNPCNVAPGRGSSPWGREEALRAGNQKLAVEIRGSDRSFVVGGRMDPLAAGLTYSAPAPAARVRTRPGGGA
jgi:hypothetical protein